MNMGIPPQSITSGIQAHFQLPVTGNNAMPAAARIPPIIGATEDARSLHITVAQKITALNAIKPPPMISKVTAKVICDQITRTISQATVDKSRSQSVKPKESRSVIVPSFNVELRSAVRCNHRGSL